MHGWTDGLGAESESFEAGYRDHSREFVSCFGGFLGPGCSGQKIRPAYFSGKTRVHWIDHREQVGRHVLRVMGTWAASRFIPRDVSGGRTACGETGEFFEPRQRPQPIVYGLSRNVLGLWLRWLENTPPVLLGKNEGCGIGRAEHIGQQVVPGNRYLGRVVFNTACCIWPAVGLGAGTRSDYPPPDRIFLSILATGPAWPGPLWRLLSRSR